jgi:hypothetical protein
LIAGRLLTLFVSGVALYVPLEALALTAGLVALIALVSLDRASLLLSLKLAAVAGLLAGLIVFLIEAWLTPAPLDELVRYAASIALRWAAALVGAGYVLTGRFAADLLLLAHRTRRPILTGMACAIAIPFGWTGEAVRRQREVSQFRRATKESVHVPVFSPLVALITDYLVLIAMKQEAVETCLKLKK